MKNGIFYDVLRKAEGKYIIDFSGEMVRTEMNWNGIKMNAIQESVSQ